jgi:hypothetical protein
MGNTVMDYIVNLVAGMNNPATNVPVWDFATQNVSQNPADIFVIIELRTGGRIKGNAVSANCNNTLVTLVTALNTAMVTRNLQATYHYNYATSLITGNRESVGVIYNDIVFNQMTTVTQTLRNNNGQNLLPRTPMQVSLTELATGNVFEVNGLHAPPVRGGQALRYRPPIDYLNSLSTVTELDPTVNMTPPEYGYMIMGDYNCSPLSSYTNGMGQIIQAFGNLNNWGYLTRIPNGTKSSYRIRLNNALPPPDNYLSEAYDNLAYHFTFNTTQGPFGGVLDLLGGARNSNVNPAVSAYIPQPVALLNNSRKVSDHQPMVLEFQ